MCLPRLSELTDRFKLDWSFHLVTTTAICVRSLLIEHQLTDPSLLAIEGRSAGGLLVGAVINMEPTLFNAAVTAVPFTDVLT
jgi:protease II